MSGAPKFTPGPWRVSTIGLMNDGALPVSSDQGQVARVSAQADFPRGQGHNSECAERDANAHLIAAAPDLYAALADLLSAYAEPDKQICCNGQHCGCQGSTVQQMAEHYARAALAKAREQA